MSLLVIGGCGVMGEKEETAEPVGLKIMVPNTKGGGYDTTARTAAKVLQETDIARNVQVFNLPGAGGTRGLQETVKEKGNGKLAMQMGLGVVGAVYASKSRASFAETTPIAKLMEEAGAIVVPRDSPYRSIRELIAAWQASPKSISVGGGSSAGGPDHLLSMMLAKAIGISPKRVRYVRHDGGGELLPAVLGGDVSFGVSGFGEFLEQINSGELRVLAVTSEKPIDILPNIPTLESVGLRLTFANWRGIVAPPGISFAERKVWIESLTAMHDSREWKAELAKHGWTDAFMTGFEFAGYLTDQDRQVAEILAELDLA
ncbi:Bug family tripartite tricarboxylate transporter substrate binding protein [Streptomyces anulatus]|uniref:Bug family tripartite tricarboxylate transporter substrate binding protein n=1 Tax=Streptomyces TaxID=1883 RepID=UPI00095EBE25|nr:tripartite tricarboxylate transporter substrate-binding protein [Streptomyces sp. TSRI0395]OKI74044.1 C4-dicarboxylate ABC transporter substrate-binding protein [Streptomyces sp. TSRI0395]